MIKFLDHLVVDWDYYNLERGDLIIRQVIFHLYNGMTFIMDEEDFFMLSDYEAL